MQTYLLPPIIKTFENHNAKSNYSKDLVQKKTISSNGNKQSEVL